MFDPETGKVTAAAEELRMRARFCGEHQRRR